MPDGKLISIDANGNKIEEQAINQSAGAGDADKILRTDAAGKVDASFLPTGYGPEAQILTASEDLSAGDLVDIWDDAGTTSCRKADASAANAGKTADGFVLEAVTATNTVTVYTEGINDQLSGLTVGTVYFLSGSTAGQATTTPVTTSGHSLQKVGVAVSATALAFERGEPIIRA